MEKVYKPVPDVECLKYHGTPEKPDIKIFVSHRIDLDSEQIDNLLYIPVRCGAVYDERKDFEINGMLGDDTGENISERRMTFCELTVQYWAWKNVNADYYGLCHYRRYLSFAKNQHYVKNQFQLVEADCINSYAIKKYGLQEESIRQRVAQDDVDVFLPELFDIREINNNPKESHIDRYKRELGPNFSENMIQTLLSIIEQECPEYLKTAKQYYNGGIAYFCNCFLMKKALFQEYSAWIFNILFKLEVTLKNELNFDSLSMKKSRIFGFFSEDLMSIFFIRNHEIQKWKEKELELVFFQNTEVNPVLEPVFTNRFIPVILSSDNVYAVYMGVLIESIIQNSSNKNQYDIIILHTDISIENQKLLRGLAKDHPNFSIRFTDIHENLGDRQFDVWAHYTKYNVYRLLAPEILNKYDKAIYMDSDIVVNRDIADLYDVDLAGNMLAAVPDIRYHAWTNQEGNALQTYAQKVLKFSKKHIYFNSGVLVYNLKAFREYCSSDFMLSYCEQRKWQFIDQDVLNIVCENKVKYLPMEWNLLITTDNYYTEQMAPLALYQMYRKAHKDPYIVHYAGNFMPWKVPNVDMYWYFWEYARMTPFYEILISRMIDNKNKLINQVAVKLPPYKSIPRKVADVLMPIGSKRRRLAKKILPKGSRRWNILRRWYNKIMHIG